jgi:hypothetical protein
MPELQRNFAQATRTDVLQDVADRLPKQVALPLFEAALLRLGLSGNNAEVTALFAGRATWNQIRDWRRGRNRVPKWAWDYLGVLLDRMIADATAIRVSTANPPNVAKGQGSHRNIAAWNARRAVLRSKNEKAGG